MTKRLLLGMAGAAILAFSPGAAAAGIISLVPSHSTVTAGDIFQVDLIATDLQIGGYDLILGYNPLLGLIEESGVLFDSSLGGPDDSFTFLFPGLDSLELGEVSLLTSPADLAARQSSLSFPLAHLTVTALSAGTLNFDFVSALYTGVTGYSGTPLAEVTYQGATVDIVEPPSPPPPTDPPSSVPEPRPGVLMVIAMGLLPTVRVWQLWSAKRCRN